MKRKLQEDGIGQTNEDDIPSGDLPALSQYQMAGKKSKLALKYHDFSAEEIARLKETESLFHSGLFRLQVNELLKNVSVKLKLKSNLESAVDYLATVLPNLPEGKEHQMNARKWLDSKDIKIPLVENPPTVKGVFHFVPPSEVKLVGSFQLGSAVKPDVSADMVMLIPKNFFQGKDYLNHRYTRKRALYLAAVASHLSKKKKVKDVSFAYHLDNPQKPVLVVSLQVEEDMKAVTIVLHAVPDAELFKLSRFHIVKNNVRPKWFHQQQKQGEDGDGDIDESASLPATKFYNANILHDLCLIENHDFVTEMLTGSEGIRLGLILLKIWLRQRELSKGHGKFSPFLMTAFVAYLLMTNKINKRMNSYQILKTTLFALAKNDWQADPPSLFNGVVPKTLPSVDELKNAFDVVFLDHTGGFNLAYMMSSSVYMRVKACAVNSVELLDRHHQNSFDALFMTPMPFTRTFDHVFHVSLTDGFWKLCTSKSPSLSNMELDHVGFRTICVERHIESLLRRALDKRILHVQAKPADPVTWNASNDAFNIDSRKHLTFGLILDPSGAFNLLDKGPPADDPQATAFRAFWGDVSEMRRFKDGSIHEAVLWSDSAIQSDKRLVCKKIVQHILKRHCGIPEKNVLYQGGSLDSLLHVNLLPKGANPSYGTGEEQSLDILKTFEGVNSIIRSLDTLPLSIHSVQGTHPVFRHADVFPPLPTSRFVKDNKIQDHQMIPSSDGNLPPYTPVLPVLCMLEGSGSWPEEKEAMDCMKTLLHIKMGTEIRDKHLLPVRIQNGHVNVLKDGYAFRLTIACMRELAVLRTVCSDSGMVKFKDTDESVALERAIVALPLHSHLLHGIQQEHLAFSSSLRLCKRWVASHMVWDHINEEAIELIVASLFINSYPFTVPASPSVGFIRFLTFLASFSWKTDILMVNINKEFTEQDYQEVPQNFMKNRSTLPAMCIATPQDKIGTKWTRHGPTESILDRLVVLAKASLKTYEDLIVSCDKNIDFKQIFRPLRGLFDVTIKLRDRVNVLKHQALDGNPDLMRDSQKSKQEASGSQPMPVLDFNASRMLLNELKCIYGDLALFFFDPYGGSEIGLVWKSTLKDKKDFKPSSFVHRTPVTNENETVSLEVKKDLILDDIYIMGRDVIDTIQDHRK